MSDKEARTVGRRWIKAGGGFPDGSLFRTGVAIRLFGTRYAPGTPFRVDGDIMDHKAEGRLKGAWPDPRDPATLGTWLATVRERYDDPTIYIEIGFTGPDTPPNAWLRSGAGHDAPYANESTEAEALVSALESKERP